MHLRTVIVKKHALLAHLISRDMISSDDTQLVLLHARIQVHACKTELSRLGDALEPLTIAVDEDINVSARRRTAAHVKPVGVRVHKSAGITVHTIKIKEKLHLLSRGHCHGTAVAAIPRSIAGLSLKSDVSIGRKVLQGHVMARDHLRILLLLVQHKRVLTILQPCVALDVGAESHIDARADHLSIEAGHDHHLIILRAGGRLNTRLRPFIARSVHSRHPESVLLRSVQTCDTIRLGLDITTHQLVVDVHIIMVYVTVTLITLPSDRDGLLRNCRSGKALHSMRRRPVPRLISRERMVITAFCRAPSSTACRVLTLDKELERSLRRDPCQPHEMACAPAI